MRIFIVALLVCAAGCAALPGESSVPEVGAQVRALHLPFDDYSLSGLDRRRIGYAEDVLIRGCMRAKGMDWTVPPPPPNEDPDPLIRRRYGLIEPMIAARYGYHRPPAPAADAVSQVHDRLPPAEHDAAYGPDGCAADAQHQLLRDLPGADQLDGYGLATFEAARTAPETVQVFQRWSACLRSGGTDYPDPLRAIGDPAWLTEHPSTREIAVAELDVRCKQSTNLVAIWSTVEARSQRAIIEAHADDFARFAGVKQAQIEAARRVAGGTAFH